MDLWTFWKKEKNERWGKAKMKHPWLNPRCNFSHFGCGSQMIFKQGVYFLNPCSRDKCGLKPWRDPIAQLHFSHFKSEVLPIRLATTSRQTFQSESHNQWASCNILHYGLVLCGSPHDGDTLLNVAVAFKIWLVHWNVTETFSRPRLKTPRLVLLHQTDVWNKEKGAHVCQTTR